MTTAKNTVAIIGAGIAGLASSVRLAQRGYQVEVFEANDYPGGKLSAFDLGDFRFDAGPSLFTMPQYVDELFLLADKNPKEYFNYQKLPIVCNYFWEDGTRLHGYGDLEKFASETERVLNIAPQRVRNFFKKGKLKYELSGTTFLQNSLHRWDTWLTKSVAKALMKIPKLDLFKTMHQVHEEAVGDPKMVQLLDRFATYNGSNPYKAPGLLSMIPHFEHSIGAFYPKGGMISITQSIYELAISLGVKFNFSAPVQKINSQGNKITGVEVEGRKLSFEKVISNMDVFYTYKKLLPDHKAPEAKLKQERSSSALIFYWGMDRIFPELDLHNIFFSNNYKKEFEALGKGAVYQDPTIYVNISSKYSAQDAPKNCENWFVMINVPYNSQQDWEDLIPRIKSQTIQKLSNILGSDIGKNILMEETLDPRGIESKTSSYQGALYGTSSNNKFSAFMRHANYSSKLKNLYFCGGSVHPGGGIPLCLLSAKIVDDLIKDGY